MAHFISAVELNLVYLGVGMGLYVFSFHIARKRGLLLQIVTDRGVIAGWHRGEP
jgi:hypothetical protein